MMLHEILSLTKHENAEHGERNPFGRPGNPHLTYYLALNEETVRCQCLGIKRANTAIFDVEDILATDWEWR